MFMNHDIELVKSRLIEEIYEKVIGCKITYKQLNSNSFNPEIHQFDSKTQIIKTKFLISSYISEIWILYNLLNIDKIQSILKVKLSPPQKNLFDYLRLEMRNNLQHIDDRIQSYIKGESDNPYIYNIFGDGESMKFQFGGQDIYLRKLEEIVDAYFEPVVRAFYEARLSASTKNDNSPEGIMFWRTAFDLIINSDLEKYK